MSNLTNFSNFKVSRKVWLGKSDEAQREIFLHFCMATETCPPVVVEYYTYKPLHLLQWSQVSTLICIIMLSYASY